MPDKFANKFYGTVTESAANTLTFSELQTNVSIFEKVAWVIHRLEWFIPYATWQLLAAAADKISCALTASNTLTALGLNAAAVIDLLELDYFAYGTAANTIIPQFPIVRDFSNLPGGGLIVAPRPLYVAAVGVSLTAVSTVSVRGYFTTQELKADEYLELVDFYRIVQ